MKKKLKNEFPLRLLIVFVLIMGGCDFDPSPFQEFADQTFGDQHLKTSIALIELHKIRFGSYPKSLDDIKFKGEWDEMALNSVQYKLEGNAYQLSVSRGWVGKPRLKYSDEFYLGLGLLH